VHPIIEDELSAANLQENARMRTFAAQDKVAYPATSEPVELPQTRKRLGSQ
jgi:hypothetical protein